MTGCWTCGGAHFASDCPRGKSKGKGKSAPAYGFAEEEDWEEWEEPTESIMRLSYLREVEDEPNAKSMKPTVIRNRFQALESAEREEGKYDGTDGAVVFSNTPAPPAPFALSGADLLNMAKQKKQASPRNGKL